jgi:chemotaxis protein MotB
MRARRRGGSNGLEAWPGYVDALSTLLMVIIFVLLVFVLAQAFLSVALSGRDQALARVNRQMAELSDMLSLERGRTADLRLSIAQLNRDLQTAGAARDSLATTVAALRDATQKIELERDRLSAERDRLAAQLADAQLQAQSSSSRTVQLQSSLADAAGRVDSNGQAAATAAAGLAETRRQLQAAQAELQRTVLTDRETVEARLAEIAHLADQVKLLTALRDDLEKQAKAAGAQAAEEAKRRQGAEAALSDGRRLAESARAQIALLTQQVEQLRLQLTQVAAALDVAEKSGRDKDAQISNLGQRLNTALAAKVEELQRYRSEFFGRLRTVLADRPGIQIVGDRFVFQSEVLFPAGSADMTGGGQDQINALAVTLRQIAAEIPPDLPWLLRVDGHADRQKMAGGLFASNWELSAERAINVVKLLIANGVPATHLAATAFSDNQPLAGGDTPDDYAKNRRIELRLTDR